LQNDILRYAIACQQKKPVKKSNGGGNNLFQAVKLHNSKEMSFVIPHSLSIATFVTENAARLCCFLSQ
jgi:hypothetical protein